MGYISEYALTVEEFPSYLSGLTYKATITMGSGLVFEWFACGEAEAVSQAYLLMQREVAGVEV
jgi:hypothetical protein